MWAHIITSEKASLKSLALVIICISCALRRNLWQFFHQFGLMHDTALSETFEVIQLLFSFGRGKRRILTHV